MSASSCRDLNISAIPAASADLPVLPSGHTYWGILAELEPAGFGLVRARIHRGAEYLVDEALYPQLLPLLGKQAIIGHIDGKWQAGAKST